MKKMFEVVKVFDIEPIILPSSDGDSDTLLYRLEILREVGLDFFIGKVYRQEFYRLQPTFPQENGAPMDSHRCDESFFVEDDFYYPEHLNGHSVLDVIEKFQKYLTSAGLAK